MHVLGIVGSPRVNGNTDILVDEILSGVRSSGGTIGKIYISDFDIKPCVSCMTCKAGNKCPIEDQMGDIYERVLKADGIVLGSPVYWNCVSAQMKIFMDRAFAFLDANYESALAGKVGSVAVACGSTDFEMTKITRIVLNDFFKFNKMNVISEVVAAGVAEKGDALKNNELMRTAFQAGRKFL
ncbi:MAG TPA: flavodoxin family protein [Candidatus Wallbacteria bacterium]|nr:flavodoxin family protein [Candidatus Wallbacteria bacterium]